MNFFAWDNPVFQRAGIIVPAVTKKGETRLTARNSHQTRRAMADLMANKVGVEPSLPVVPILELDLDFDLVDQQPAAEAAQ